MALMKKLTPEKTIWIYRFIFLAVAAIETLLMFAALRWAFFPPPLALGLPAIYFLIAIRPAFSDIKLAQLIEARNPQLGEDLLSYIELKKTGLDYGHEFVELLRDRAIRRLNFKVLFRSIRIEPWGIRLSYIAVIIGLLKMLFFRPLPSPAVFPHKLALFEDSLAVVHVFGCEKCVLSLDSSIIEPVKTSPTESKFVIKLKHHGEYRALLTYKNHVFDTISITVYPQPVIKELTAQIQRFGHPVTLKDPDYVPIRQGVRVHFTAKTVNSDSMEVLFDTVRVGVFRGEVAEFDILPKSTGILSFWLFRDGLKSKSSREVTIDIVKDEPPFVQLLYPSGEVNLPDSQRIALIGYAEDDFGLKWLEGRYIFGGDTTTSVRKLSHGQNSDTLVGIVDLSGLGLLPGDAVSLIVCAQDIGGHRVCSPPAIVKFPTMEEIYRMTSNQVEQTHQTVQQLNSSIDSMMAAFRQLEEQIKSSRALDWNEKQKLQQMVQEGKQKLMELQKKMEQLKQAIETLQSTSIDPELSRKLEEISRMLDQLMPDELKRKLNELQKAATKNDLRQVTELLNELQQNQEEYMKKLEAMEKLLKRAMEESKLQEFIERARQLAQRQDELRQKTLTATPENIDSLLSEQDALMQEAQSLRAEMQQLSENASDSSITNQLNQMDSKYMSNILKDMENAKFSMNTMKLQKATRSQSDASQKLQQMADELQNFRNSLVNRRKEEFIQKMALLISEGLTLSDEQAQILASDGSGMELGERQAAVQRGLSFFAGEVYQAASEAMFLQPEDIAFFGKAANEAAQAAGFYGTGNTSLGRLHAQNALKWLNIGIRRLLQAQQAAQKASSSSNMDQFMQMLSDAMQKQQQIASGTQMLLPLPAQIPASLQQLIQELIQQQMELAQQLQRLSEQAGNQMVKNELEGAAKEAEQIARDMQAGQINQDIVRRQKDVARKLLDAQRAMKEKEFSPRRESKPGQFVMPQKTPSGIRELMERERIKKALLKSKSYPEGYRKLIEAYYKTLLNE